MTGYPIKFSSLSKRKGENVTFSDNSKGKIVEIGNIGGNFSRLIENVLLVNNLKHSLLSIRQLCDKGYKVISDASKCLTEHALDERLAFTGHRHENIYTIDIDARECFKS